MDDCDLGNQHAAMFLDHALARARSRRADQASRETCIDCGEQIPVARQRAVQGCQRCIECASALEGSNGP